MMRIQTNMVKRVVILAGLFCAMLGGSGLNSVDSATAPAEEWMQAQTAARDELDYATVLDIVR